MKYIIILTVLPPLFLLWYVYHIDKVEQEPVGLVFKLFIFGVLSCFPASRLEEIGEYLIYLGLGELYSVKANLLMYFLVVALAEEGLKYIFMYQGTWRDKAFNYRFDGIVYAVAVSIGFALFENILYVLSSGEFAFETAAMRALTSIPLHTIAAIFMGHFYGEARYAYSRYREGEAKLKLVLALVVPVLIHGFYDFCLSVESTVLILIFYVYIILLDIFAFIKVRRYAKEDVAV